MQQVAGIVPFTSIDFPGCLATVVFFQGCPLRCPFCHNPELQIFPGPAGQSWEEVMDFLKGRVKRLDGVVFSGGEPLMSAEIVEKAKAVKAHGFKLAIHTSGVYPERLREMLPFLDWVGLDIKAPWEKYDELCGRPDMVGQVQSSLKILVDSGIDFEARTTCDPRHLIPSDTLKIARDLNERGVKTYALQKYRTFDTDKNPPSVVDIEAFFEPENLSPVQKIYPNLICR
ncbi:MAG: anaerobic ribonucleoside-triphosphate reductase activating protein [Alphaproteobacteria bacterium]|nr:anaerobic ribonucleoside-triphosphate reductase activating protein [Alphaproteobacteria bacterium]